MTNIARLRGFIQDMTRLAGEQPSEARWLEEGGALLKGLVGQDDWLPEALAEPGPTYRQYLLHCDPLERFSVVSFVWGIGQRTPVHNHKVWGLVGMLRGAEVSVTMHPEPGGPMRPGQVDHLRPGEVVGVGSGEEDVHWVENAIADRPSISIHVYGGNIGAIERHTFDPATSEPKRFVSGYTNAAVPNLWDRSAEVARG
ncbi:cysteine dioxygenase [Roseococcus sp. SYP-B2431]|uniref:cysteine dioxygenase family protein n=1 Tax=Roseococcus sp. SYP-B2431 TaxID=2496640 RepID=UPI0010390CA6|nr:cysteine dioxygenase [Roseococcus sp. SYP-B2431]TCH99835.1 cysteine dioxygenase [Roseococcus sp. SYP-B2431]